MMQPLLAFIIIALALTCTQSYTNNTQLLPIARTDFSVPLFVAKDSHHVHVYIGAPPQRRIVIVDTGSRLLVFPCEPCIQCGTNHVSGAYFDPQLSSTDLTNDCDHCVFHQKNQKCINEKCLFRQSYTEGSSMDGFEMEDIVWLGTQSTEQSIKMYMHMAVPMTFGCQTSEKGIIQSQYADGILGLSNRVDNIITNMFLAGSIPNYAFSLCLTRTNGIFSIGGTSSLSHLDHNGNEKGKKKPFHGDIYSRPIHLEKMHTVPISKNHGYFSIQIIDFHVGKYRITSKDQIFTIFNYGKGTIIDSGTTDTYLPIKLAKNFKMAWLKISGKRHSNERAQYTYEEFQRLPNVTFTLENGYRWTIQADQYMEEVDTSQTWDDKSKQFYNRIYLDEQSGAILGANAMINHDILFDFTNKVIGVASSKCGR